MNRCPYLGLEEDKNTCMSFASTSHMCFKISKPKNVPIDHQLQYCLHDEHIRCPVLLNGEQMFPAVKKQPVTATLLSKTTAKWAAIATVIIVLVWSFWWVATNTDVFTRPDPPVQAADELPPGITPTVTRANESIKPEITLIYDLTSQPDSSTAEETPQIQQPNP